MDFLSSWWRVSHPTPSLALVAITVAAVVALVLFEHVIEWPVLMETERTPDPAAPQG